MRSRFLLPFVSALTLGACALPSRDNRFDPSSAPEARLKIEDLGSGADCATASTSGALTLVAEVAHGHCLLLDARDSSSPDTGTADLLFEFSSVDTSGTMQLIQASGASAIARFDSAALRALPLDVPHTFAVTVRHGSKIGVAKAQLVPRNTKPIAVPDPPRTLPLYGFPWALGSPFVLPFDGSRSVDPDGDAIARWCWTLPGASAVCSDTSPNTSYSADSTVAGEFFATLQVFDSVGAGSDPVSASWRIGDRALWASRRATGSTLGAQAISKLDETWREVAYASPGAPTTGWSVDLYEPSADPAAGRALVLDVNQLNLDLVSYVDLSIVSIANVYTGNGPVAEGITWDAATGRAWVISGTYSVGPSGPIRDLQSFRITNDQLVPEFGPFPVEAGANDASLGSLTRLAVLMETDAGGNVYYAHAGLNAIRAVDQGGQPLALWTADPGDAFEGLARRPGTNEIWATEGEDLLSTTVGSGAVLRLEANGTFTRFESGDHDTFGLAWIDDSRFWVRIRGNACLVDVTRIAGSDLTTGIVLSVPIQTSLTLSADPETGTSWWLSSTFEELVEIHLDGTFTHYTTPQIPIRRDLGGDIWSIVADKTAGGAGAVARSKGVAPGGVITTIPIDGGVATDYMGGVWVANNFPRELVHIAQDGTILERIARVRNGSADQPTPALVSLGLDAAGRIWAAAVISTNGTPFFGLAVIDLTQRPAPDEATLVSLTQYSFFPGPVAPIKTGTQSWVELGGLFASSEIHVFDDAGQSTNRFTFPTGEEVGRLSSVEDLTGAMCLLTADTTNLYLRYIPVSGTIKTPATIPITSGTLPGGVDAERIGAADVCWIAWRDAGTAHLSAYNSAGTLLRDYSDTGTDIRGIVAEDASRVWLLRADPANQGRNSLQHLTFSGASVSEIFTLPSASISDLLPD